MGGGMVVFFIAFIVLGSWSMLSLLTGVMSEHMIEKSAARKEEMKSEAPSRSFAFCKLAEIAYVILIYSLSRSGWSLSYEYIALLKNIIGNSM